MHILIGLILAFVLVAVFSNRKTRYCRWRMDKRRDQDGQRFYLCTYCGQSGFTENGKPPKLCLRKSADH
ncbi:MAG: hypothetical protein ACRBBQ_03185 [Cognatishimia sp.]